jgi:phenylpropionate dioxygenase-like ring-hydroxylating dioxygenase large terminal subunit
VTRVAVRLRSEEVPRAAVVPIEVDGHEYVVWRARSGALCAMARQCPHLDWDLAEAWIEGDELVCPGHGWSFDASGHAFKRNLLGRVDPKDDVTTLPVDERDGTVTVGG